MNKKIQHIRALVATTAAIALLMLAPTACVNTIAEYEDPEVNNPEAELDPSTPVAVSAILSAYGTASPTRNAAQPQRSAAEPARAASTLADIGTIPAKGEITASTTLGASEEATAGKISLFGANTGLDYYSAHGAVSSFALKNGDSDITLHMSDFNTKATHNGTKQVHSRLGMADFQNSSDRLIGFADRTLAADKSIAYQFAMRHATAKVSVLVVDITGTPINMSTALNADLTKITTYDSNPCIFETESGERKELSAYMKTTDADGDYPSTTATNAALATIPVSITKDHQLGYPTTNTVASKNLINVIVTTNPTAKADGNNLFPALADGEEVTLDDVTVAAIATGLSETNAPAAVLPFDDATGKDNRHRITIALNANDPGDNTSGIHSLNLNDIALTDLPEGDGRAASGHLRYLLPGEHVVVTLKIDRNKLVSATATIAPWIEVSASGNEGDEGGNSELANPFNDLKFCAALAAMSFNADGNAGGNLKLTLTADGYIDMSSEANRELISKIKRLDVSWRSIKSLKGIEYFTSLTSLDCYTNSLTALDLSANTKLTSLNCYSNQITTLDLSANTELTTLNCSSNYRLAALDVSHSTKLTTLECYSNKLTALDVTNNTKLTTLECYYNSLTALDVSKNTTLTTLSCYNNSLTALDVSKNTTLNTLYCNNNSLTTLDVTLNTTLTTLSCNNNSLTELDVTLNTTLTTLNCNNNSLTALDVSKNIKLDALNCSNNPIGTLDVSKNTSLSTLNCSNNQLGTLDVTANTNLYTLNCSGNSLTDLGVSKNASLSTLNCSNNQLGTLDVTANINLNTLDCSSNSLTILDVTANTKLNKLSCYSNHLIELDASKMIVFVNSWNEYELYCGNQTTDGADQNLALTLGQKHKSDWDYPLKNELSNRNVTVTYATDTPAPTIN